MHQPRLDRLKHLLFSTLTMATLLAAVGCSDSTITQVAAVPPGPVGGFEARIVGGTVTVTWSEPPDADVSGSLLARFTRLVCRVLAFEWALLE
jgi:hypothetical protein